MRISISCFQQFEPSLLRLPYLVQMFSWFCKLSLWSYRGNEIKCYKRYMEMFFSIRVFFHRHWRFTGQQGKRGHHALFFSVTSTRSWAFRHLFATLRVRWLPRIFNRIACNYQAATQWVLPSYWIAISIDWWCNVSFCLFSWWFDSRFLLQYFVIGSRWIWNPNNYHYHPLLEANWLNKCASHPTFHFKSGNFMWICGRSAFLFQFNMPLNLEQLCDNITSALVEFLEDF